VGLVAGRFVDGGRAVIDPSRFAVFAVAAMALLVVPGPAVIYIVAQSLDQGRRAGVVSVLGIHTGSMVHVLAATVGLSQLLVSSATAYTVVKYAGAAYLIGLGVRRILTRDRVADDADPAVAVDPRSNRQLFRQGVVVNVLNPKTALFFLAFLPQFVDVDAGRVPLQIAVLGVTFVLLGLVTDTVWALAAGTLGSTLRRSARVLRIERLVSGSVFIALGALTAASGRPEPQHT
jgi:threonine/homoserine/homoserine lactone efflux protein